MAKALEALLSKHDAIYLLELTHSTLLCSTEEDLNNVIKRLNNLIPYESASAFLGKKGPDGLVETCKFLNLSYPGEFVQEYSSRGYQKNDPIVTETFKNWRLHYWGDTIKKYTPDKGMVGLGEDFGFKKAIKGMGYAHGLRNIRGTAGSIFSFYGLKREARTEAILNLIVPHLHQAMARQISLPGNIASLSEREKEVLRWISRGKCTWDVSEILGISERTVKFHVRNILEKLDCINRAHAVAIAMEQGLIDAE